MFDEIATGYDRINRVLSFGMDRRWRKKLANHLPNKNNLKILDLATGTCDQLLCLLKSKRSIDKAYGIDLSKQMLLRGREKIDQTQFKNKVELIHADAQKLPFKDNSFDAATFSFGIRNVPDPVKSLKEIYRILKPSGKCLILEFSLPPYPLKTPYLLFLRHILPKVGNFLSKSEYAYTYLNQTIETFPCGKNFLHLLREASFTKLKIRPMALGAVSLYEGVKA